MKLEQVNSLKEENVYLKAKISKIEASLASKKQRITSLKDEIERAANVTQPQDDNLQIKYYTLLEQKLIEVQKSYDW